MAELRWWPDGQYGRTEIISFPDKLTGVLEASGIIWDTNNYLLRCHSNNYLLRCHSNDDAKTILQFRAVVEEYKRGASNG